MGVRGLQTYLEHSCSSTAPNVDIAQLVVDRRRQGGDELVIVVDGCSCIRHLYRGLEWVGGGQLVQFGTKARQFVEAFKALNVHLVFFFDGPTVEEKRNTWIKRRLSKVEPTHSLLDKVSNGAPSTSFGNEDFILPPGLGQLSRVIFQTHCECEVYQSSSQECDEEIAEYARENQVFAVLTQDSDYAILDLGGALYLSMQHLDLANMTTKWYNREELARRLRLPPCQLPLLATMMGNDLVTFDALQAFHHQITGQNSRNCMILVPKIAKYIQSLRIGRGDYLHDNRLMSHLARQMLRDYNKHEEIRASLRSYDTTGTSRERAPEVRADAWSQLVAEARERHVNNEFPSMVFAVMSGRPFESSTSIEDFRMNDIPTFASASESIRQRIYGILLQEKPLEPGQHTHHVKEWCMAGPHSLDRPRYVQAVFPQPRHPGLLALWNDSQRRWLTRRWMLFVHSVSPTLDVERLRRSLPPHMVIPTLILYYINEKYECLLDWEVDAMLATAASLKLYNVEMLEALPADPMSSRSIRLANLIMRMTFVLYFLLAACGYPLNVLQTSPLHFFDGKLFQRKYREAALEHTTHQRLCESRVDVLEEFNTARRIVFN